MATMATVEAAMIMCTLLSCGLLVKT